MDTNKHEQERLFHKRLIERMEGILSESEQRDLNQELADKPALRKQFIQMCAFEYELRRLGRSELISQSPPLACDYAGPRTCRLTPCIAAVAACLIVGLAIGWAMWISRPSSQMLARLEYEQKTKWLPGHALRTGDALRKGHYHLHQGKARLLMQDGTLVTVGAPARFELVDEDLLKLSEGTVSAKITKKNSRFTIRTAAVDVLDLGTAFGVQVGPEGLSTVSVFEGAVAVKQISAAQPGTPLMLKAGNSMQANSQTQAFNRVPYNPLLFETLWPLTNGIDEMAGLVQFVLPGPISSLDSYGNDETIFMVPEQQRVRIAPAVQVDITEPGEYAKFSATEGPLLKTGQVVDSYLLFYNNNPRARSGQEMRRRFRYTHFEGTITFARPIVAVIATNKKLATSDGIFGLPDIAYGDEEGRGLEPVTYRSTETGLDVINISENRRRLTFSLRVGSLWVDQFRVLVASPPIH